MPASASSSSDWPLPATPATPRISPSRNMNETPSTRATPRSSRTTRSRASSAIGSRMSGALVDLEDHLAPDHGVGELGRRGLRRFEVSDDFAPPHHRDAVGQAHDLAQLVGDEDDRLVLALEHAQHLEQLIRLGRRQHRGRLVEHEDLGAAHQRLQDLDPLLQADRQFADDGVGIDFEAVFAPELRRAACGSLPAPSASSGPPSAPSITFSSTLNGCHQHEMLEDHADAVADRFARGADPHRLAIDADFARVGFIEAVEDRHQRRFAGPVFADDAVDDSALDREIDVIVGVNRAEALVDADQFDGGRGSIPHVPDTHPVSCASWPGSTRPSTLSTTALPSQRWSGCSAGGRNNEHRWPGQARP